MQSRSTVSGADMATEPIDSMVADIAVPHADSYEGPSIERTRSNSSTSSIGSSGTGGTGSTGRRRGRSFMLRTQRRQSAIVQQRLKAQKLIPSANRIVAGDSGKDGVKEKSAFRRANSEPKAISSGQRQTATIRRNNFASDREETYITANSERPQLQRRTSQALIRQIEIPEPDEFEINPSIEAKGMDELWDQVKKRLNGFKEEVGRRSSSIRSSIRQSIVASPRNPRKALLEEDDFEDEDEGERGALNETLEKTSRSLSPQKQFVVADKHDEVGRRAVAKANGGVEWADYLISSGRSKARDGNYVDALADFNEALEIQLEPTPTEELQADDEDVATTLTCVGIMLARLAEANAFTAFEAIEKALTIRQRVLGAGHPDTCEAAHNMWIILHNVNERKKERREDRNELTCFRGMDLDIIDPIETQVM